MECDALRRTTIQPMPDSFYSPSPTLTLRLIPHYVILSHGPDRQIMHSSRESHQPSPPPQNSIRNSSDIKNRTTLSSSKIDIYMYQRIEWMRYGKPPKPIQPRGACHLTPILKRTLLFVFLVWLFFLCFWRKRTTGTEKETEIEWHMCSTMVGRKSRLVRLWWDEAFTCLRDEMFVRMQCGVTLNFQTWWYGIDEEMWSHHGAQYVRQTS